eukprot:scaffold10046_cov69-Phaeocystis_antarctica.AAC.3
MIEAEAATLCESLVVVQVECSPMCWRLQPNVFCWRLQPKVLKAAALCAEGCNAPPLDGWPRRRRRCGAAAAAATPLRGGPRTPHCPR